jgi:hypothetical protein
MARIGEECPSWEFGVNYTRRQIVLWRANRQLELVGISTNRFGMMSRNSG